MTWSGSLQWPQVVGQKACDKNVLETKMCWRQGYSVNRAPFIKQNYVQKAGSRLTFTRVPNTSGHVDMYYLAKLPAGYSAHPYIMKGEEDQLTTMK